MLERRRAEHERPRKNGHRNTTATIETSDCTPNVHLDTWDPTQQELDAWDERVLQIVKDLETTVRQRADTDKEENINNKQKADDTETASAGFDRNGAPSLPYRSSLPPFIQAAADGNLTTLQELLQEAKAKDERAVWDLLHTRDRHLSTAEHWSAGGGHISCLRFLLELRQALLVNRSEKDTASASESLSSAPVGKKTRRRDGKTCLHYAARNGHVDCIAFLLDEQNHNIDDVSGDGTTPFHMACFGGHVKVARLLMKKGANIFATNEWGCSAAHWIGMTISKNVTDIRELCSLLRTAGVSFSEQQKQGHSALHKAAQKKNRPVIEWMAESSKQGGATLSTEETERAGRPDDGGHVPSEIWRNVGGEEAFAEYMEGEMGW
jgi:ankyrin repeat protein